MPIGFKNFGSTCWINSNLQCILHQTKFQNMLKNIIEKTENNLVEKNKMINKKKNNIIEAIIHIFYGSGLYSSNSEITQPNNQRLILGIQVILNDIFKLKPSFLKNNQQDAHESILFLLDLIHQNIYEDLKQEENILDLPSKEWFKYHNYQTSEIYDMFYGQNKQIITNLTSGEINTRYEPYLTLYLSLPNIPEDFLNDGNKDKIFYFKVEDSIKIWQEKHKMDPNLEIYVENQFYKLPDILLISFLSNSLLQHPYQFIPSEIISIKSAEINQNNGENIYIQYELTSLLFHLGNQHGGHYLCACKEKQKWISFNDEIVNELPNDAIKNSTNYLPVVLFYQKINS